MPAKPKKEAAPKHGTLRVWWIPQVPMKPFQVDGVTLAEAKVLLDALAQYDLFQLANRIKPDYANAGGLNVFDANDATDGPDGSWIDWYGEDGQCIDDCSLERLRTNPPKWEMEGVRS